MWGDISGRSGEDSDDVMYSGGVKKKKESNKSGGVEGGGEEEGRGYNRICSLSAMHQ